MITVIKRNGERVPLDISKIQRQVAHACKGIDGVSPSMVEIKAQIELHDGMSTKTIDELFKENTHHLEKPLVIMNHADLSACSHLFLILKIPIVF